MELNKQSDLYNFMIEKSMDIIFLLDSENRFIYLNRRVETLLGFTESELIGQHFSELIYPNDLTSADLNYTERTDLSETELSRSIELSFRHKQLYNKCSYFDVKLVPIPDDIGESYSQFLFGNGNQGRRVMTYGVARDITRLKSLEYIINTNANRDCLTGLPNRILLKDRMNVAIAHAKREACHFAVMFIDLDGFKQVNDTYSHSAGDIVLQAVSSRLKACLRAVDTLARVGGDEFVLLLPNIHKLDEIRIITDKLLNEINKPFIINNLKMTLSASIGISLYPDDGETFDNLVNGADRSMYYVKHNTKNGYAFFSEFSEANKQGNIFDLSFIQ